MKSSTITLLIVCGAVTAGTLIYLNRQKTPATPVPVAESTSLQTEPATPEIVESKPEEPRSTSEKVEPVVQVQAAPAAVTETKPEDSANPIHKMVDDLLSAKNGAEKHAMFEQLAKAGKLDEAIAELQQRAKDDPNNPQLPTTVGEALLNKVRAIKAAGGDLNDMGILAMQADKNFNAALKIDPQNWEAQFVKASSLYYWPADPTRDNDVVQRLSNLIDQQDTMAAQPQFAQPYVVLGNQYLKLGQPEKAAATWQLGLSKFPTDPTLRKKVSGQ